MKAVGCMRPLKKWMTGILAAFFLTESGLSGGFGSPFAAAEEIRDGNPREAAKQLEIYIPGELSGCNFEDPEAEWCFARSKESEHFILFWQKGFVAHLSDGSRVYSEIYSSAESTVSFTIPEKTRVLYFIVAGTPEQHIPHKWDDREINDRQLPYEIKYNGL